MVECLALGREAQVQVLFARVKGFQNGCMRSLW